MAAFAPELSLVFRRSAQDSFQLQMGAEEAGNRDYRANFCIRFNSHLLFELVMKATCLEKKYENFHNTVYFHMIQNSKT